MENLKQKWITQKGASLLDRLKILLGLELGHTPPNHEALEIAVKEAVDRRENTKEANNWKSQ